MIDKELKNKAFELRRLGKSYNYIKIELGISKGALFYWFNNKTWSKNVESKNREAIQEAATLRILRFNDSRRRQRQIDKNAARAEAESQFEIYKDEPLFIGALMVYLGEGDKSNKTGRIGVSNIDPYALKIFINFLKKYCEVSDSYIKFWLLCYPEHDKDECENWWSEQVVIPKTNFYKTQVIQGKHKTNRLRYGVGNIIMSRSLLKTKILRWIELMSSYLARV